MVDWFATWVGASEGVSGLGASPQSANGRLTLLRRGCLVHWRVADVCYFSVLQ